MRVVYNYNLSSERFRKEASSGKIEDPNFAIKNLDNSGESPKLYSQEFPADQLIHVPSRRRTVFLHGFTESSKTVLEMHPCNLRFPEFKFLPVINTGRNHWHPLGVALLTLFQISDEECIPFYLPTNNFWGCVCLAGLYQCKVSNMIDYFWYSSFSNEYFNPMLTIKSHGVDVEVDCLESLADHPNYDVDLEKYRNLTYGDIERRREKSYMNILESYYFASPPFAING